MVSDVGRAVYEPLIEPEILKELVKSRLDTALLIIVVNVPNLGPDPLLVLNKNPKKYRPDDAVYVELKALLVHVDEDAELQIVVLLLLVDATRVSVPPE